MTENKFLDKLLPLGFFYSPNDPDMSYLEYYIDDNLSLDAQYCPELPKPYMIHLCKADGYYFSTPEEIKEWLNSINWNEVPIVN